MLVKFLEANIDYLSQTAVSDLTKKWYDLRMSEGEIDIRLNSATYNTRLGNDYLELVFFAKSTYGNTSFVAATNLPQAPNGWYTLAMRFYGLKSIMGKGKELKSLGYQEIENRLKRAIHSCDVKFYSDDPSFFYQGCWEDLDKANMSIYKYTGPQGKGIWRGIHAASGGLADPYIHITKHLAQVINEIDSYIPQIAQNLKVI